MMAKPYFKTGPDQPEPLRLSVPRTVRFEEVDPLGIVWHGRYSGYFEDARVALGKHYGIGYMDFYREKVATPIRKLHIDYFKPLSFEDEFTIEGLLHWNEAARLDFEFILRNAAGEITTTGYTVQMMMNTDGEFLLAQPDFYVDFCRRWQTGELL
jgi:acyl-CoA thioester hydrolase